MNIFKAGPFVLGLLGLAVIFISYQYEQIILTIIGSLVLMLGVFIFLFFKSIEIFQKDKEFNKEELVNQGLTIVVCSACETENVLEDQYCRKCGDKLEV